MQPIPAKVKNVNIYPYIDWPTNGGVGPVIPPIVKGASGEYSVGTLNTCVYYNLNVSGGEVSSEPIVHNQYTAIGEYVDGGGTFFTPAMTCLQSGPDMQFGATQCLDIGRSKSGALYTPSFIKLSELSDITLSLSFQSQPLTVLLIQGGSGYYISAQVGNVNKSGVEVDSWQYRNPELTVGMRGIMATGTAPDGNRVSLSNLVCVSAENPLVFIQQ